MQSMIPVLNRDSKIEYRSLRIILDKLSTGKLLLILLLLYLAAVWCLIALPEPLFKVDYSTVVLDREGEFLRVFLNEDEQWCLPPTEQEIPHKLKEAVICFEDKRFYSHPGIDPFALARALWQNLFRFERISGASTITMQVARLARPKERNLRNKVLEMVQALKIELKYDKEDIFKLYLDHAPYGGNIIGYQAAAYRYFGKSPEEISWAEAATLAVLPNNPALINPVEDSETLKRKRDFLLEKLLERGGIDRETYRMARAEPVPDKQIVFETVAPHLAERVKRNAGDKIIQTTIDKGIQSDVNTIVQNYMEVIKKYGINNCAVLIAETESGAVRAYIGSNDYFDAENSGMVDGVRAFRSSGSILKPFLYGLAMDEGLILPQSQLKDIPVNYGAYRPYNYSRKFEGMVSAREALVRSLNAPTVALLDEYGVERFYSFLKNAGISSLFRLPEEYGLPLILGGAEVSLWETTSIYRGLGNYGSFGELTVLYNDGIMDDKLYNNAGIDDSFNNKRRQLITGGSSYLVLDILKDLKRPGIEYSRDLLSLGGQIAWKTGTSYGNRDAWAAGVSPEWTIGVWVGNFDGRESKALTGLQAAAPLFFRIFNYLEKDGSQRWFEEAADLKEIEVSAQTGYRLRENQLKDLAEEVELINVKAPALAKPLRYSPYEKVIYLNQAGTEEVCSFCREPGDVKRVLKAVYPPEVVEHLKARGYRVSDIPSHRNSCPVAGNRNPIQFTYPSAESVIVIPRGLDGEYQKVTARVAHSYEDSKLYWYLDREYLGETAGSHHKTLSLDNGQHVIHVVDGNGYFQEIAFYVRRSE
ncbi:MAG TPA: penicillin-binding protein 1C [Halanaerobiales bacterium]|nr:penicillin-binding protein 1C [Halanaerobiales bacterium]